MTEDNRKIFNRTLYATRRNRVAAKWSEYDFLKREAADRLCDRLDDMTRAFPVALDLGCHVGELAQTLGGRGSIETLVQCDYSEAMLRRAGGRRCVVDEEFLPFGENTFDLVMSALSLHHINDLPGTLIQIRRTLKPDGLFLCILPGAQTLIELRESVTGAAAESGFVLSPRLSPLVEVRDAGALLQRAGFALPVVDSDTLTIEYDSPFRLMQDLRGMGESNVLWQQKKTLTSHGELAAIAEYYRDHFAGEGGIIPATFEFVTLTGWKPHDSQQQPLQRGSGKVNMGEALK